MTWHIRHEAITLKRIVPTALAPDACNLLQPHWIGQRLGTVSPLCMLDLTQMEELTSNVYGDIFLDLKPYIYV